MAAKPKQYSKPFVIALVVSLLLILAIGDLTMNTPFVVTASIIWFAVAIGSVIIWLKRVDEAEHAAARAELDQRARAQNWPGLVKDAFEWQRVHGNETDEFLRSVVRPHRKAILAGAAETRRAFTDPTGPCFDRAAARRVAQYVFETHPDLFDERTENGVRRRAVDETVDILLDAHRWPTRRLQAAYDDEAEEHLAAVPTPPPPEPSPTEKMQRQMDDLLEARRTVQEKDAESRVLEETERGKILESSLTDEEKQEALERLHASFEDLRRKIRRLGGIA